MTKKILASMLVMLSTLMLFGAVHAQDDDGWRGEYYDGEDLDVLKEVRYDEEINFDWGDDAPFEDQLGEENWSVRWTRTLDDLPAGNYEFRMTIDDGGRLYADGILIIDQWHDQFTTYTATYYHDGGDLDLQMDYYENRGNAVAKLIWVPVGGVGTWRGEYYDGENFLDLEGIRYDDVINFNWGLGAPFESQLGQDNWSVRWTRTLELAPGTYEFIMSVDDGGRLYVNGNLLLNYWQQQTATYTAVYEHPGGNVNLQMDYYERFGNALAQLSWVRVDELSPTPVVPSEPVEPVDGYIIDNTDAAFRLGGYSTDWEVTTGLGYGDQMRYTRNSSSRQAAYEWARWYFLNIPMGNYEVLVYVPEQFATTRRAPYWVRHTGGYTQVIVDQLANQGQWVSLGTYHFGSAESHYISLSDVTEEPNGTSLVAFDAVAFVPR